MNVPSVHECADQKDLIHDGTWDWLIWFDGARWDYFNTIMQEYVSGNLYAAWNNDHGYTGDWTVDMLSYSFDGKGLFSPVHLSEFGAADYEPLNWFDVAPRYDAYEDVSVDERLAALGYKERSSDNTWNASEDVVNLMVRDHLDEVDGGVIRYTKPHPPFEGLHELTSGSGKIARTKKALEDEDITVKQFIEAYIRTLHTAFEAAVDIIPDLNGDIVITADHGECLYDNCDQVFHARTHEMHDHLTVVPWYEVTEVVR